MALRMKWPIDTFGRLFPDFERPFQQIHQNFEEIFSGLRQLEDRIAATGGGTLDVLLSPTESFYRYALIHVGQDRVANLASRSGGEGSEATHILSELTRDGRGKAIRKADGVWRPVENYSSSGHKYLYLGESGGVSNTRTTTLGEIDQRVGLFYLPADSGLYECWLFIEPYTL